MDEHIVVDEETASLYGHADARSILSASTSSRVTLNGPRQRPKGPRTSDASPRSSLLERAGLPLSPLAKEILTVQSETEESSSYQTPPPVVVAASSSLPIPISRPPPPPLPPASSASSNQLEISIPNNVKPRRASLAARFSFRRSKSASQHESETIFIEDPFRATPHPSVQWDSVSQQKADLCKFANSPTIVSLPTQSNSLLMTPVSQIEPNPKNAVLLKPKRSFFRRMADKFLRLDSGFDTPKPQIARVNGQPQQQHYHPHPHHNDIVIKSPVAPLSPQLPTPSSPSLARPFTSITQPVANHHENSPRTSIRLQLTDPIGVRSLPVLSPHDHQSETVYNPAFRESTPTPSVNISNSNGTLYRTPSTSPPPWQPITPISPLRMSYQSSNSHTMANLMLSQSVHTQTPAPAPAPVSRGPSSMPIGISNHYSKEKATSVRNLPIVRNTSVLEKRKAMSVRSQPIDYPATSTPSNSFNARTPKVGGDKALMDLDKAMFEKELAREREPKPSLIKGANTLPSTQETKPAFYAIHAPNSESIISLTKRESKRQSIPATADLRKTQSYKPLPPKPSSAPGASSLPSSSSLKRGFGGFSVNLDASSDINIPMSALSIDPPFVKEHRLYPDVLYTADQSNGYLNGRLYPLPNNTLSRRSLPVHSPAQSSRSLLLEKSGERPGQTHFQNSTDKVSRWLTSAPQFAEPDETDEGIMPKHRDKGKGRAL